MTLKNLQQLIILRDGSIALPWQLAHIHSTEFEADTQDKGT